MALDFYIMSFPAIRIANSITAIIQTTPSTIFLHLLWIFSQLSYIHTNVHCTQLSSYPNMTALISRMQPLTFLNSPTNADPFKRHVLGKASFLLDINDSLRQFF